MIKTYQNETWKDIPGFPKYEASDLGRVRNKRTRKIRKPVEHKDGYFQLKMMTTTKSFKMMLVHRLILFAFRGEREGDKTCDHLNFNRKDNRIENLEWVSNLENTQRRYRAGRFNHKGEKNSRSRFFEKDIFEIRDRNNSTNDLAKKFKASWSTINNIKKGRSWKHL